MSGTTAFPGALDSGIEVLPNTKEDEAGKEHDVNHNNKWAAILALEAKVGTDSSADTGSIDFRLATAETTLAAVDAANSADVTIGAFGSTPDAKGASLAGQVLTLQPADATHPGAVTTGTQTFAGDKTFTGNVVAPNLGTAAAATIDTDVTLAANSGTRVPSQSAVKGFVENYLTGLTWKASVRAATTAAGTLSSSFANGSVIDGVTLVTGDRILIKNQATGSQNGIYIVAASGSPARSADADSSAEMLQATMLVREGTTNADQQWTCTNDSITLGSTALVFAQVSGSGTYSADEDTLHLSGNQFSALQAPKLKTARAIDGQSFDGTTDITVIAPGTHASSSKPTPVDADEVPLVDSAASNVLKKLTWANVKATLKTYFDTLYVALNGPITGATKTKITYDAKGLVTSGADATTADIADSSNKRYVTDAQLTVIGNTSGTNTGDQNLSGYAPLASPALTGTPTVPTAAPGTNTTQAASTAFVSAAVAAGALHFRRDDVTFDGVQNALTLGGDPYESAAEIIMRSGTATRYILLSELTIASRGYTLSYTPANNDVAIVNYWSQVAVSTPTIIGANDPYFSSVVTLLHFDGTNGSTTFTDQKGKTYTAINATLATGTKKYGTASGSFNGSSTSVSTPHSSDFDFGSGDFDIELWINPTALPGATDPNFILDVDDLGGTRGWQLFLQSSSGKIGFSYPQSAVYTNILSAAAPSTGAWTHVCIERFGSVVSMYVNGTSVATHAITGSIDSNSNRLAIGTVYSSGSPTGTTTRFYNGFIDDLRITKGVSRYRANFTPQLYAYQNA